MGLELKFGKEDRIAIIAPHPDDECLGASAALIRAADRTDVIILTDGCRGCKGRSLEEEAIIRREQFEAEMEYVHPHSYKWLGVEDTKMASHPEVFKEVDLTPYTIIFLPWIESLHPDHRYAATYCIDAIRRQKSQADCYFYEITAPFRKPTHYIDITDIEEEKRKLVRFHKDQVEQENITLSLNAFRGAQMINHEEIKYAETYLKVDINEYPEAPDLLLKLYTIRDDPQLFKSLEEEGIGIKRVMPMNITKVYDFIRDSFARTWADEALPALIAGNCFIAVKEREILGFYAIETPFKNSLGPMGVISSARTNIGIARALELTALNAMREKGYRYAISGMVHPLGRVIEEMACELMPIPGSAGSYGEMI